MIYQLIISLKIISHFIHCAGAPQAVKELPAFSCKTEAKWRGKGKKGRESLVYEAYPAILADLTLWGDLLFQSARAPRALVTPFKCRRSQFLPALLPPAPAPGERPG